MEVRTDAIQQVDGGETLVNVCHTVMVALDKDSGKPFGKVGRSIPDLLLDTEDDHGRRPYSTGPTRQRTSSGP